MKTGTLTSLTLAVGCLASSAGWADSPAHIMVKPDQIQWAEVATLPPGAQVAVLEGKLSEAGPFTARLKFPPDYRLPPHSHPAIERVTVLSGTFNIGMGDRLDTSATEALTPGSLIVMAPGTKHFVWTSEETVVQLNGQGPWGIQYVNPQDDPRNR